MWIAKKSLRLGIFLLNYSLFCSVLPVVNFGIARGAWASPMPKSTTGFFFICLSKLSSGLGIRQTIMCPIGTHNNDSFTLPTEVRRDFSP